MVDSARRRGGNRRKSESQVGIHPSKCFRRRLATSSCSACRTFAVYSSSAVLRAVLVSRVAFRRRSLSNSRRQWRFRACFVPQRCRPTGPTHGRFDLPRLSPWTFACAHPPDAWRLSLLCSFPFCVCGGFVLLCAPRPACLGAAPRRPSCCLTSSFSYSMGWCRGGRLCSSSGGNRRKSESQGGIHPVLPSPPSDVCVLGSPYARCLSF